MTIQDEKTNTGTGAESCEKRLLKFTCPQCGGHVLEEVVLMRQEIEGLLDPEDPDYDWDHKGYCMVVLKEPKHLYAFPSEHNYFRCCQCKANLTDEDGQRIWGTRQLYQWLLAHGGQPDPGSQANKEIESKDQLDE